MIDATDTSINIIQDLSDSESDEFDAELEDLATLQEHGSQRSDYPAYIMQLRVH